MTKYVHLLQEFLSLGGYDTSFLSYGDTDLVTLKEDENLLVIFNNHGDEDLFMIFDKEGVTITFGEWFEVLHGDDFSTFEYLVEIIREILAGTYYVKEVRLDNIEFALLCNEETDQIVNSCIISGAEELKGLSAFDFIQGLDYSEAYFDEIRWDEHQSQESDEFYWWDDDGAEEDEDDDWETYETQEIFVEDLDEEDDEDHEHHCCCGYHHHHHE